MNYLTLLEGMVLGAVAAWLLARGYAAAELSYLRDRYEEQVRYWQGEAERAKIRAAQLCDQAAAWVAGCQQGREDVLSVARSFAQHSTRSGYRPGPS